MVQVSLDAIVIRFWREFNVDDSQHCLPLIIGSKVSHQVLEQRKKNQEVDNDAQYEFMLMDTCLQLLICFVKKI